MKQRDRYNTEGTAEGEFEDGSHGGVLKNLLSVKKKREMNEIEFGELARVLSDSLDIYDSSFKFTSAELCNLHKRWLGRVYTWAGSYRQVNMSKDGFPFAAAHLIPALMSTFEKSQLDKYTPCQFSDEKEIIEALAIVHVEFVLIHPFREGNGRMGRLLASIMALQAGLPLLDFGGVQGQKKVAYFAAVQAGLGNDYEPMKKVFEAVIKRTLKMYR